jgi:hypothetical protein
MDPQNGFVCLLQNTDAAWPRQSPATLGSVYILCALSVFVFTWEHLGPAAGRASFYFLIDNKEKNWFQILGKVYTHMCICTCVWKKLNKWLIKLNGVNNNFKIINILLIVFSYSWQVLWYI